MAGAGFLGRGPEQSHGACCVQRGPALTDFLLKPFNILCMRQSFCTGPAIKIAVILGAGLTEKLGDQIWTLGDSPAARHTVSLSGCSRNLKSGMRAREKFVMRTPSPRQPPPPSFSLSKEKRSLSFCIWTVAGDTWQGGRISG